MDSAIMPDVMEVPVPTLKPRPNEANDESAQKQRELARLADHPGWDHFRTNIQRQIQALRELRGVDISAMSPEEVGTRYLISREAAILMESELQKVESLARATRDK